MRLNPNLTTADLADASVLHRILGLLHYADEHGPLGLTEAGNLKLAVVNGLIEPMRLTEDAAFFNRWKTRITEIDLQPLHIARVIAERAGLLDNYGRRIVLSDEGRDLLDVSRIGELYALLFRTRFRDLNLAYGALVEWRELQYQIAFTLYRLPIDAREWRTGEDLITTVVLPFAYDQFLSGATIAYEAGFRLVVFGLEHLVEFGLLERSREKPYARSSDRFRVTPLMSKFIGFEFD